MKWRLVQRPEWVDMRPTRPSARGQHESFCGAVIPGIRASAPPQVSVTRWMPSVQRSRLYRRQVDHAYLDVSCGAARQI
jgi:hypothetical protein